MRLPLTIYTVFVFFATQIPAAQAEPPPAYLASIMPVHSLVAGVLSEEGQPTLIVPGHASPHGFTMKPSQAKLIEQAELVFIIDRGLERFLEKAIKVDGNGRIIELSHAPGVTLLATRRIATLDEAYEEEEHQEEGAHKEEEAHEHGHAEGLPDYHVWLSPDNAVAMTGYIAEMLSRAHPEKAAIYKKNAEDQIARINRMKAEIGEQLNEAGFKPDGKSVPYLTYHDAYQYFETSFGLQASEFLVQNPEHNAGAAHMEDIEDQLKNVKLACIFSEPQFNARITQRIADRYHAELRLLNPDGSLETPGKEVYFNVMRSLANTITDCMKKARDLSQTNPG